MLLGPAKCTDVLCLLFDGVEVGSAVYITLSHKVLSSTTEKSSSTLEKDSSSEIVLSIKNIRLVSVYNTHLMYKEEILCKSVS